MNVTGQLFMLTSFITVMWAIYFAAALRDYRRSRMALDRRRGEGVKALRRVVIAFCVLMLPLSFFIRTGLVLAGFGNDVAGVVVFFSLAGTNVVGSIFCVTSLRYD